MHARSPCRTRFPMKSRAPGGTTLMVACAMVALTLCGVAHGQGIGSPTLLYDWTLVELDWTGAPATANLSLATGTWIPQNNAIAGVKVWKDDVYVTVPRWRPGVPVTLAKLQPRSSYPSQPLLEAYPSWAMQSIGDPQALQYVQSMEIDSRGWMWILDVGRFGLLGEPFQLVDAQPKLVIWDIDNDCLIHRYYFPHDVVPPNATFLNDLVVDETRGFAYISNTWANGGIVVYDFNTDTSRMWNDVTLQGNATNEIIINGVAYPVPQPSDGIALTHQSDMLYYCALSRTQLYRVPTKYLRNFSIPNSVVSTYVEHLGVKGYSDGMAMDSLDRLFFGAFETDSVHMWDTTTSKPVTSGAVVVAQSTSGLQWVDTFAFGSDQSLYFTSNKLGRYVTHTMQWDGSDGANFRLWKMAIGASSYMSGNPEPPSLPCQPGKRV